MNERSKRTRRANTGVQFEKLVSEIQQQFDPNSQVAHNVILTDRLGHERQFDVVIRGSFAGQSMLGVMECKDLGRNVGLSELEAFITKCHDVNANMKILVSSKGFTRNAVEKGRHHGIQTLSLLPAKDSNTPSPFGTRWYADVYFWSRITIELHPVDEGLQFAPFDVDDVRIGGRKVIDWFKNHLIEKHACDLGEGWLVNIRAVFATPQTVSTGREERKCKAISFHALRTCERKAKSIGWKGTAYFDWQQNELKPTPNAKLSTEGIPTDFRTWEDRGKEEPRTDSFLYGHFTVFGKGFEPVPDAIDLDAL